MGFSRQRRALFWHGMGIESSKSGPNIWCFVHVCFHMCFAPQPRTLFPHLNFHKWSEPDVLWHFYLTSKCASRHNGVQFFISYLASWLRTRRFSRPTFRSSGATRQWKNTVFRDFPTFSRICIFSLLTFSLSDLLHLWVSSWLRCFSIYPASKLPSKIYLKVGYFQNLL